jgi:hypothetical protein
LSDLTERRFSMSDPNYCDITVVLDRSGSMGPVVDDTIGGFNRFLQDQQAAPGRATLTLVQFDHEYEFVHQGKPVGEVPPLDRNTYGPRGSTALLDAVGRAIQETGARLEAMPEGSRPGKVIFVILTDGMENASREFTRDRINQMISHQREVYSWDFLFLGANQNAIHAGAQIGIAAHAAMTFANNTAGNVAAYGSASNAVLRSRSTGTLCFFGAEDREAQRKAGATH